MLCAPSPRLLHLATKVYFPMPDDPADRGLSPAQISRQIDASPARLRTDRVELYQAHRFDPSVPVEDTVEAFLKVVEQGKAPLHRIQRVDARADPGGDRHRRPRPVRLLPAAVLHAAAGPEAEVFGPCAGHGISQIVWSPLAQGVLTGTYRPGRSVQEGSRFASADRAVSQDPRLQRRGPRRGPAPRPARRGGRYEHGDPGARLGPANRLDAWGRPQPHPIDDTLVTLYRVAMYG
ncbi:aldo/keto reductase [Streptomyces massasporeus]|uniref:aldo/keto reductase n=1 Tax=Streptomyces massasporeus TaxID=67324 RepID=UPI0033FE866A